MIDLEALEAKRAARRGAAATENADDDADEKTPPPAQALARDPDATGTMAKRRKGRARNGAARLVRNERPQDNVDEEAVDEGASDDDAGGDAGSDDADRDDAIADEATERDEARGGTRSGMSRRERSRAGGAPREGTRTGMTRVKGGTVVAPAKRRKPLSPIAAAAIVVIAVVALVVVVFVAARATAVLTVTTVPHGATVTLDGEAVGTSPLQKRVRTGSHVVELALAGYEPFREVVDVPSAGLPFLQPLKALPPPPPPPPTSAEIAADLMGQAKRLFDAGDLDGAIAKVDEIERLVPDHVPSSELRAAVRAAQAKRDTDVKADAASAARQAQLARSRQRAEEGRRLYDIGKLGPARTALFDALKLDARNPDPHRTLAKIFNREGEVEKVRYHLERFIELGGNDADFKVREWLKAHPQ
jgi:hypothetical protein